MTETDDVPCRACGDGPLELFLDLGDMPLAGGFLSNLEEADDENLYPLRVFTCKQCSLVQIVDVVDPSVLFQDYSFASSTIPALVEHFNDYAQWIVDRFRPKQVAEFGCNDGVLLRPLEKFGVEGWGVDISENIGEIARSEGLNVVTGFFDRDMAMGLRESIGPVDLVTGSNAFAHNEDPGEILNAARLLLEPQGHLCLEFMYAGDLLALTQWDTLYHEHLTFYSLETLSLLLERHGFKVVHVEHLPMHAGSLRVVAAKENSASPDASVKERQRLEEEMQVNQAETWLSFGRRVGRRIDIVAEVFRALADKNSVWGYGAAGRATLWVNACKMNYLGAVVDASPLRAGKLMPGTHTPIVFPGEMKKSRPDHVFVTAWNYASSIQQKEGWYQGVWSTPLPELRFF